MAATVSPAGAVPGQGARSALGRWWFPPVPLGRVAVFRTLVYGYVLVDVLLTSAWVRQRADTPSVFYRPLLVGRLLPLPTPTTAVVTAVLVALVVSAALALTGRWPRLAGAAVAVLYLEWMVIAFSYGKVDHDRFAFLVALALLATVGRARWGDRSPSEAGGWALRCVQVGVVAAYLLAAVAKLRFGGLAWLDSATLLRAVLRRGTALGEPLAEHPELLHVSQYVIVLLELASPLLFVRGIVGRVALGVAFAFHVMVFATVAILFTPHVVALCSFLPLERISRRRSQPGADPAAARPAPAGPR